MAKTAFNLLQCFEITCFSWQCISQDFCDQHNYKCPRLPQCMNTSMADWAQYRLTMCQCIVVTTVQGQFKVNLLECCVVPNDAWPPLEAFGVIPNPPNVHVHVHGALLLKNDRFFLHSIIWPLEINYSQFYSCEMLFMRRRPKYSASPCNIWKSFTLLLPS